MTAKISKPLLAVVCWCFIGCDKGGGTVKMDFRRNKDGKGTIVAEIGNDSVTAEDLKKRLSDLSPFARARYQTLEQKKEYLDNVARFELMAQEALRRGLQNDPDVVDAAKKQMVTKLLQKEINEKPATVTDDEIKKYYDDHKSDYVKPEMVRTSQIFISASKSNPAEYKKKKAKGEELLARVSKLSPFDFAGFNKVAKESSEDPKAQTQDTDTKYITVEELTATHGSEVAKAVADIKSNGGVSPLVETDKGFRIIKLQGRQSALNLTVEQVKQPIQSRIQSERRSKMYNEFVDSLKKNASYKIHEDVLAKVEVDAGTPPGGGPFRGGPPGTPVGGGLGPGPGGPPPGVPHPPPAAPAETPRGPRHP